MTETEQHRQLPDWLPEYRRLRRVFSVRLSREALESLMTDPTAKNFLTNWVSFEENRSGIGTQYPDQYVAVDKGQVIASDPFSMTTVSMNIIRQLGRNYLYGKNPDNNRPFITSTKQAGLTPPSLHGILMGRTVKN